MPSTSLKQKKLMDAAAHNPAFAKKVGVPVKVAKEYSEASKGQTFKQGGEMKESKVMMKKEVDFMKKKGAPKSMIKHEMAESKMAHGGRIASKGEHAVQKKSKRGADMVKMASGGMASKRADGIAKKGKTVGKMLARGGKC
jgi:hypothetical protein